MHLYNRINKEELKRRLAEETFQRKTISFYRYFILDDPKTFRDDLFRSWFPLDCFGRIYVAREGINAQMSVPEHHWDTFLETLKTHEIFKEIPIKYAIEDDGKSFYKLTIKVRPKLVADGLNDDAYDVTNVGTHLSGIDFHNSIGQEDTVVVDMRNYYESEIGHFEGAICPEADTFREELEIVTDLLEDKKDKKVLQSAGLPSKFVGKNFVFDERLGESVNGEVIARCHQCGKPCDTHTNCANTGCHILFIQCPECAEKYHGCCTPECAHEKESGVPRSTRQRISFGNSRKYRKSLALIKTEQLKHEQ